MIQPQGEGVRERISNRFPLPQGPARKRDLISPTVAGRVTATLLRLLPPCRIPIRHHPSVIRRRQMDSGSSKLDSGGATGGIHSKHTLLLGCVQGAGTYSPPGVDRRLLGIPCSRRRVAAVDPNCALGCEIGFLSRGCGPLSRALQPACGPEVSGHTDLPWPPPSSTFSVAVSLVCPATREGIAGN